MLMFVSAEDSSTLGESSRSFRELDTFSVDPGEEEVRPEISLLLDDSK